MKAQIELTPASNTFLFPVGDFVPLVGTGGIFPNIDPANIQSGDMATIQLATQSPFLGGTLKFGEDDSTGGHMKIVGSGINAISNSEVINVFTQGNVASVGFKAENANVVAFITADING